MKTTLPVLLAFLLLGFARADELKEPKVVNGQLEFKSRRAAFDGIDVGLVGDTRKYIAGEPDSPQRAIWHFEKFPKSLTMAQGDIVSTKLRCSQFHLVKAVAPGAGIVVRVVSHTCPQVPPDLQQKGEWQWAGKDAKALKEQYEKELAAYQARKIDPARADMEGWKATNALAEKYGYYEIRLPNVLDLVKTDIDLPAGLFRNALKKDREVGADRKPKRALVSVYVKCDTPGLLVGMEEGDCYFIEKVAP
jgi:hypothetical protein